MNELEDPKITRTLNTGYPRKMPDPPTCPVCKQECEILFCDRDEVVFACENCVKRKFV